MCLVFEIKAITVLIRRDTPFMHPRVRIEENQMVAKKCRIIINKGISCYQDLDICSLLLELGGHSLKSIKHCS